MTVFAIRQKSSGLYLPPGGKGKKGHTKQEPTDSIPPRLFPKKRQAERALACYVSGRWYEHSYTNDFGEWDNDGSEPKKGTERNGNDFEVVELELRSKR